MTKENGVWVLVLFDIETTTAEHRAAANTFRNFLKRVGFTRYQYSVYTRYAPSVSAHLKQARALRANLPAYGTVTILYVTDREWHSAERVFRREPVEQPSPPDQLTIF